MNEQNINNVVFYLQQNPDQPTDVLVQSLIGAGYPINDIRSGLNRLGLSPLSLPSSSPTISNTEKMPLISGRALLGIFGAAIILIGVYYMGNTNIAKFLEKVPLIGKRPQLMRPTQEKKVTTTEPTISTVPQNFIVSAYNQTFQNSTLKIVETREDVIGGTSKTINFLLENGFIDKYEDESGLTIIARSNGYYILQNNTQQYFKVETTDLQYETRVATLQNMLAYSVLFDEKQQDQYHWIQIDDAAWKIVELSNGMYYKITFNEDHLPAIVAKYDKQDKELYNYIYTYEPIVISEEMLSVPKTYKQTSEKNLLNNPELSPTKTN